MTSLINFNISTSTSNKPQSFVNRCLLSIMGIHWPEVIRNEDLWARTEQEGINIQIRRRKWGMIGHTHKKPNSNVTRHALRWNPQRKRKHSHPRNSWRSTVDNKAVKAGYTWKGIEKLAKDKRRWQAVPMDLWSTGSERK